MGNRAAMLLYTICFCIYRDKVLLLYRHKSPNKHLWNGLGGKIHQGETPFGCIEREMMEEAGIDLRQANNCYFAGIITWTANTDATHSSKGMYAYIAKFTSAEFTWEGERLTEEGVLCWKPLQWVCDPHNTAVVNNIPHFLPGLLSNDIPLEYYCHDQDGHLIEVIVRPLPIEYLQ